jgi:hypothetical protein
LNEGREETVNIEGCGSSPQKLSKTENAVLFREGQEAGVSGE